jgi:uncharacterized protein (TIGR02145 family)
MVTGISNQTNNSVIEKYRYDDDPNNCIIYGGFYQWNEAMQYVTTQGAKGICPTGWHIPTYAEFQALQTTVSNNGNSLKAIGQGTGGGAGTNTSGFSALLTGFRSYGGNFFSLGYHAYFWSSTEYTATVNAYYLNLNEAGSNITRYYTTKEAGFSVRCVKD